MSEMSILDLSRPEFKQFVLKQLNTLVALRNEEVQVRELVSFILETHNVDAKRLRCKINTELTVLYRAGVINRTRIPNSRSNECGTYKFGLLSDETRLTA